MSNNMIIVESPVKVKTIKNFSGSGYQVIESGGYVRDMPKSQLRIGRENDYESKNITIREKSSVLADIRKEVKKKRKSIWQQFLIGRESAVWRSHTY